MGVDVNEVLEKSAELKAKVADRPEVVRTMESIVLMELFLQMIQKFFKALGECGTSDAADAAFILHTIGEAVAGIPEGKPIRVQSPDLAKVLETAVAQEKLPESELELWKKDQQKHLQLVAVLQDTVLAGFRTVQTRAIGAVMEEKVDEFLEEFPEQRENRDALVALAEAFKNAAVGEVPELPGGLSYSKLITGNIADYYKTEGRGKLPEEIKEVFRMFGVNTTGDLQAAETTFGNYV